MEFYFTFFRIRLKGLLFLFLLSVNIIGVAQTGPAAIKSALTANGVFSTPTYTFTSSYDTYRLYSNIKGLLIDGLDYAGHKTKVFCWYGVPTGLVGKAPAVILLHGGGGNAYPEWVNKWTQKGYIAIAIALEGQVPDKSPTWAFSGPKRLGFFDDTNTAYLNQWFYHALADVILTNSLIRTFPEVDATKIGITGISWGGIITNVVTGIDNRFQFSIPVYGCGYLFDAPLYKGMINGLSPTLKDTYLKSWDPSLYIPLQKQPTLFVNGTNDYHFTMNAFTESYAASVNEKYLRVELNMQHGHQVGWAPAEIYNFADYITKGAEKPLTFLTENIAANKTLNYSYAYNGVVDGAILYYTTDPGDWSQAGYQWLSMPLTISTVNKTITGTVPVGTVACYVNVVNSVKKTMYSSPMKIIDSFNYYDWLNYISKLFITPVVNATTVSYLTKVANPNKLGIDTSSLVSSFVKSDVNGPLKFSLNQKITDLSLLKVKLKLYFNKVSLTPLTATKIRLVLGNSSLGTVGQLYKELSIVETQKWVQYTFDFTSDLIPANVKTAGGYDQLQLSFAPGDNLTNGTVCYLDALKGSIDQTPPDPYYTWFDFEKTLPVIYTKFGSVVGGTFTEKYNLPTDVGVPTPSVNAKVCSKFIKTAGSNIYAGVNFEFPDGSIKDNTSITFTLKALLRPKVTTSFLSIDPTSVSVIFYLQDIVGGTKLGQLGSTTAVFKTLNGWENLSFTVKSANLKYYDRIALLVMPSYGSPKSNLGVVMNEDFNYYFSSLQANENIAPVLSTADESPILENIRFSLYPNPALDKFNINTLAIRSKIYNARGGLVETFDFPKQQFDISAYPKGIYLLKAELSTGECCSNYFIKK